MSNLTLIANTELPVGTWFNISRRYFKGEPEKRWKGRIVAPKPNMRQMYAYGATYLEVMEKLVRAWPLKHQMTESERGVVAQDKD